MTIGESIPMLDAVDRIKGTVPYNINLKLPDMLAAKVLRSQVPHGKVLSLDISQAESLPGVATILTPADFDKPGSPNPVYGMMIKDQPIVAGERIRFIGEPLALVAAEDETTAEEALSLIDVDYEELPAVYDPLEGLKQGAPVLHSAYLDNLFMHAKLRHGDLEAGFAAADEIFEETYTSPVAQQTTLEPHVVAAQWLDGKLTVWSGTQAPHRVREVLGEIFNIEPEDVRIIVPPLGGGYGGKGHIRIEPMVAALAWKVGGRPVKLVLERAEEFVTVTKHAATITIKTGVKRDGQITARKVTAYWGGGAYADASPALVRSAMVRALGPYRFPAAWVDSYGVYTNLPPAAAFRGAMSSQTTWAYESHMDTIAHRLKIDPLEIRRINLLHSGDTFATGETLHNIHFADCLETVASSLGWSSEKSAPTKDTLKRGRGLGVMIKSSPATSKSQCRLVMEAQNRVLLFTSTVEMGQGAHTALAQIASHELGIKIDAVKVIGPDTDQTPYDATTSASRSTLMMGNAVLDAVRKLKEKLRQAAVPLFEHPFDEIIAEEGSLYVKDEAGERIPYADVLRRNQVDQIEVLGEMSTKGGLDSETGQGIGSYHYHQGAGACEVEVDTESGQVRILRYSSSSFAGRVVNPQLARLQNDGNVIFGLGPALMEEMIFNDGQVINANFSDYQVPSFLDIPMDLESFTIEAEGSEFHGIGEMTLPPVAPAIANAIYDATGVRIRDLPITSEKVLKAIRNE